MLHSVCTIPLQNSLVKEKNVNAPKVAIFAVNLRRPFEFSVLKSTEFLS